MSRLRKFFTNKYKKSHSTTSSDSNLLKTSWKTYFGGNFSDSILMEHRKTKKHVIHIWIDWKTLLRKKLRVNNDFRRKSIETSRLDNVLFTRSSDWSSQKIENFYVRHDEDPPRAAFMRGARMTRTQNDSSRWSMWIIIAFWVGTSSPRQGHLRGFILIYNIGKKEL